MQRSSKSIAEQVREVARSGLVELGASAQKDLHESTLIRCGNYCGHRYRLDEYEAVWFIEEDELKFSNQDRTVARTMVASEAIEQAANRPTRRAA